jgi:hypothetical protein
MNLKEYLVQNKKVILEKWFDRIIDSYPTDSSNFLRKEKNRFNNPVGYNISHDIEFLYDSLLDGGDDSRLNECLEDIVRIRTVQDFTPSEAVAFILLLKDVLREELAERLSERQLVEELLAVDGKIDRLGLRCFDAYMKCREKIYEIKANEAKMRVYKLLERTNLIDGKSANGE